MCNHTGVAKSTRAEREKKRVVLEWIYAVLTCQSCGAERRKYYFMGITGVVFTEYCTKCGELHPHTIVAHDVKFIVVKEKEK